MAPDGGAHLDVCGESQRRVGLGPGTGGDAAHHAVALQDGAAGPRGHSLQLRLGQGLGALLATVGQGKPRHAACRQGPSMRGSWERASAFAGMPPPHTCSAADDRQCPQLPLESRQHLLAGRWVGVLCPARRLGGRPCSQQQATAPPCCSHQVCQGGAMTFAAAGSPASMLAHHLPDPGLDDRTHTHPRLPVSASGFLSCALSAAPSGAPSPALPKRPHHLCRAHMRQHARRQPDAPSSPTTCPARIIISCTSCRAGLKLLWLMTQVTAAPGAWASRTLRLASGRSTSAAPFSRRQRQRASAACRQEVLPRKGVHGVHEGPTGGLLRCLPDGTAPPQSATRQSRLAGTKLSIF